MKKENKLQNLFNGKRKIQDVLDENQQKENVEKILSNMKNFDAENAAKNILGGIVTGTVTAPMDLAGIAEGGVRLIEKGTKAALDPNYSAKDALVDAVNDTFWINASANTEKNLRDFMGLKQFEDLSGTEQLANMTGELLPVFTTGGAKGVVNVAKHAAKSAIKDAKKKAIKKGIALSSDDITKIKNKVDFGTSLFIPGVQITKNASKGQQIAEGVIQSGIPLGFNETMRAAAEQEGIFGDYSPKENTKNITLINDFRKIGKKKYVDQLKPGVASEYALDLEAQREKEKSNSLKNIALGAGALIGSSVAYRKLSKLLKNETDSISNRKIIKSQDAIDLWDVNTKVDATIADKFAYKQSAVDKKLLSQETANRLSQDIQSKINKSFETGVFDDGIELSFSPQSTYNKLDTLRLVDNKTYTNIEQFLENSSKLQDETRRYNKSFNDYTKEISTDDYIAQRLEGLTTPNTYNFENKEDFAKLVEKRKLALEEINKNPLAKELLSEISQIEDALLTKMEKAGWYSQEEIQQLRKNRTIGGILSYKPRFAKEDSNIWTRLWNYFFRKTPTDQADKTIRSEMHRGTAPIEKTYNYLDTFELAFKGTLRDIEDNTIKRDTIKEMAQGAIDKVSKVVDKYEMAHTMLQESVKKEAFKIAEPILDKRYRYDINKLFSTRYLGSTNLEDELPIADKSFYDIINRKEHKLTKLSNTLQQDYSQKVNELAKQAQRKDVLYYIENGRKHYYQVDPYVKASFDLDSSLPSMIAYNMRSLKNLVQTTITGKANPAFSVHSGFMTTHEALTLLPKLANELKIAPDNLSRWGYIKEFKNAWKDVYSTNIINQTLKKYDQLLTKGLKNSSKQLDWLANFNEEAIRADLKSKLLTKVQLQGGASAKPLTKNRTNFYELKKDTKISDAIEKFMVDHYGIENTAQRLNLLNFLQQSIKETPSVALTNYLGKTTGAIVDNDIVNPKKMDEVINAINIYTATTGKHGNYKGFFGGLVKGIEAIVPYGDIMIQSLAPKIRASGIATGIKNTIDTITDLYDPDVRYIDILHNIHKHSKDLAKNKFFEGLVVTSMIPSLSQYVWNHSSKENIEAYYQLSDYDKASKFILVNFFANGKHLALPKDQEVALVDSIFTTLLDGVVGMSRYNENDPAFRHNKLILESLSRSIGIDSIPIVDIYANTQGYDITFNPLSDRPMISNLSRNKINPDLSETAYENGLVNQEATAIVNNVIGVAGSTILGSFEEANVGVRNDTGSLDFGEKLSEGFTKSAKIWGSRNISSYNSTSKEVYNKQNIINKIASVSNKNPQQQQVYETVKAYNRNRIKPLHDSITDLRKAINTVKANGRMPDGTVLDYYGRKTKVQEINTQLQKLFAKEYQEFQNLDNLLEQLYGKNITLTNFMEKFNE